MLIRYSVLLALPCLLLADDVSFDHAVQIPEAVLQPGKYKIQLEDRLPDRAIVRITDSGGMDHYLLTVPSKKLNGSAHGLIFFAPATETSALRGWSCADCKQPLEFVYPKDDAVKLTVETGKAVLAYDPSYDKLPSNLSAVDRKIVTLWMLSPKTVTAAGKGEGLTAAKYSAPRMTASAALPNSMPKTASSIFLEIIAGLFSFIAGLTVFLWRKISALPKLSKMVGLTMLGGMVAGFALPIASSYQTNRVYVASGSQIAATGGLPQQLAERDAEVARLKARNRQLEVLVTSLRRR